MDQKTQAGGPQDSRRGVDRKEVRGNQKRSTDNGPREWIDED